MVKRRKTAAQREEENYLADQRARTDFYRKLAAVRSYQEARALVQESIPSNSPARKYYSNLGFFLHQFAAPDGANAAELMEYLRLIERFDVCGELENGARAIVEERLRSGLARRNPH
jgi:hypothetical protein